MTKFSCSTMSGVIKKILKKQGLLEKFEASTDFYVKIESKPFMPLIIERHETQVVVAHYYLQNGDLIPDPDMEFEVSHDGSWLPVAIQFASGNYKRAIITDEAGRLLINPRERLDQKLFSDMWARNLRAQGFDKGLIISSLDD